MYSASVNFKGGLFMQNNSIEERYEDEIVCELNLTLYTDVLIESFLQT